MCWQIRSHPKSYTRTGSMTNYDSLSPQKETNMTMENLPWHLAFMTKSSLKPKLHSRLCLPIFYSDIVKHYYPSLPDGNHASFCRYGIGIGTIWLDNVRCSGIESRLTSCLRNAYGAHNCFHSEDVGAGFRK